MIKVTIGSLSPLKRSAVIEALADLNIEAEVESVAVRSGVNPQPLGEETSLGAIRRARAAQQVRPGTWAVGIESGLFVGEDAWEDRTVLHLISPDGATTTVESASTDFPVWAVEVSRARGFAVTAGTLLAERTGCDPHDPHSYLSGNSISRLEIIQGAAVELFERSTEVGVYRVKAGRHDLRLPIVPVAEGVSVALFNPLGDWELTERLGRDLAKLVPTDVSILLMPDGKAQALLHVVGRNSGCETVVARKERKPYMRSPLSADAVSITSGRCQTLYLDGPDAAAMRGRRVAVVDDVVSTGSTLTAAIDLIKQAGAVHAATLAVFTEGQPRSDVLSLGHLPLFRTS